MSVGLYDQDMSTFGLLPFNLELMKISSYFKKNREIVILSPDFTPEKHTKYFLRKDFNDGYFIKGLHNIKNLQYGGFAYTNNIYIPLDEQIEICKPDTSIYNNLKKKLTSTKTNNISIFNSMVKAENCRLSLDNSTIWPLYQKQFIDINNSSLLLLHDYNLAKIEGSLEEIKNIINFFSKRKVNKIRIGMKYPPILQNGNQLLEWLQINPNSQFYSMRFDGIIDDDNFNKFILKNGERAFYRQLEYYVTATSKNENEFIEKYIQKVFRQIVTARKFKVKIKICYEQNFFNDKRWERVLDLFNFYYNSMFNINSQIYFNKINNDTLYDFARHTKDDNIYKIKNMITKQEIRDIFILVGNRNPQLFEDFYTFNASKVKI